MDRWKKKNELARDTLKLARNTLLVNLRFLDVALSRFDFVPVDGSLAVDGAHIYYDPLWVLRRYKQEKQVIVRDYLHIVFHCVFHHAFVDTLLDTDAWDLACDIAAENAINELDLPCVRASRQASQYAFMEIIRRDVKQLTAEKIYHYLRERAFPPQELAILHQNFAADDHSLWYLPPESAGGGDGELDEHTKQLKRTVRPDSLSRAELEQVWSDIARRMQTELEAFVEKRQGSEPGGLSQSLSAVTREKYDYADFLRRFAVLGEAMKVNDDEFDYIFYTYGMKL